MPVVIRPFEDGDLEAVVAFSLEAWAPVFASFETALGPDVYALLHPDWRAAQAGAVRAACSAPEHDVCRPGGRRDGRRSGARPARALYEAFGFIPLPLARYHRRL